MTLAGTAGSGEHEHRTVTVLTTGYGPRRMRNVVLLLSSGVALIMTGYGLIMPVFARRLENFGSGVEALGLITMGFALAQFALAPVVGSIADRIGRKPLILVALGGFALVNAGFIFASNVQMLGALRVLEGAVTAGMFPAALGMIGDIVPQSQRARWTGIMMGSYGLGFTMGPLAGGLLYDRWGFAAPFLASAVLAAIAACLALLVLPETHNAVMRRRARLRARHAAVRESIIASLPRPLWVFGSLLIMDFVFVFSFTFVEPQMVFFTYEELGMTTTQFGLIVTCYGLSLVAGQFGLAGIGDKLGRRRVVVGGLLINTIFYLGLIFSTTLTPLIIVALISGVGEAISMPALAATYLDMTDERHRSRVMGIRGSATSLAMVLGPLLVAALAPFTAPRVIFVIGTVVAVAAALFGLVAMKNRARTPEHVEAGAGGREKAVAAALAKLAAAATEIRRL